MGLYLSTLYEKLTLPLNHVMNLMYFQLWPCVAMYYVLVACSFVVVSFLLCIINR